MGDKSMIFKSLIIGFCIFSSSLAIADAKVGDEITGQLQLGKRNFALPPGKWLVVASRDSQSTLDSGSNGANNKTQYLVQRDADGRFVAATNISASLHSMNVASWNDATCDRKDTLYRDTLDGNFKYPACNLINHITDFWAGDVPKAEFDKQIWLWYRDQKLKMPHTVISTTYVKYFAGDFVRSSFWFNPEISGLVDAEKKPWGQSPWHPDLIKSDVNRTRYIEQIKIWNASMIKNARATLMDLQPVDRDLPALPSIGVK
jgi:hypothetical protein